MSRRLEPAASRRLVTAVFARDVARRFGADSPEVAGALAEAGLPEDFAADEAERIALSQEVDFYEAMARRLGDRLFGLHTGLSWEALGTNLNSSFTRFTRGRNSKKNLLYFHHVFSPPFFSAEKAHIALLIQTVKQPLAHCLRPYPGEGDMSSFGLDLDLFFLGFFCLGKSYF